MQINSSMNLNLKKVEARLEVSLGKDRFYHSSNSASKEQVKSNHFPSSFRDLKEKLNCGYIHVLLIQVNSVSH